MLALAAALAATATIAIGCFVDVDLSEARLTCSDGRCPSGFECVDGRCLPAGQGQVVDAGAEEVDAAPEPPPDAPPPDAPPPDAKLLTCDEQYGSGPGYQLCNEEPDSCEFAAVTGVGTTCTAHCRDIGGGECITGFDAEPTMDPCGRQEETGCDMMLTGQICVCSRSPAP